MTDDQIDYLDRLDMLVNELRHAMRHGVQARVDALVSAIERDVSMRLRRVVESGTDDA